LKLLVGVWRSTLLAKSTGTERRTNARIADEGAPVSSTVSQVLRRLVAIDKQQEQERKWPREHDRATSRA